MLMLIIKGAHIEWACAGVCKQDPGDTRTLLYVKYPVTSKIDTSYDLFPVY